MFEKDLWNDIVLESSGQFMRGLDSGEAEARLPLQSLVAAFVGPGPKDSAQTEVPLTPEVIRLNRLAH